MSLPVWSSLQFSTDNPETIEEAIQRIVAAHNDDSEAHQDEGQALESHRTEAVIDHPESSIVLDKMSANDSNYILYGRPEEGWTTNTTGIFDFQNTTSVSFDTGETGVRWAQVDLHEGIDEGDPTLRSVVWQALITGSDFTTDIHYYGAMSYTGGQLYGAGFQSINRQLRGVVRAAGNVHLTDWFDFSIEYGTYVRIFYDPHQAMYSWYLFNDLVATMENPIPGMAMGTRALVYFQRTASNPLRGAYLGRVNGGVNHLPIPEE